MGFSTLLVGELNFPDESNVPTVLTVSSLAHSGKACHLLCWDADAGDGGGFLLDDGCQGGFPEEDPGKGLSEEYLCIAQRQQERSRQKGRE